MGPVPYQRGLSSGVMPAERLRQPLRALKIEGNHEQGGSTHPPESHSNHGNMLLPVTCHGIIKLLMQHQTGREDVRRGGALDQESGEDGSGLRVRLRAEVPQRVLGWCLQRGS